MELNKRGLWTVAQHVGAMVPATLHLTSEEEFRKVPRKKEANKDARDIHREAAVRYLTGKSLPQAPQTDERRAAINKLLGRD